MTTENLLAQARARFDHESRQRILKEKYQAKLMFAHGGGMWQAGPDLVNLLQACPSPDAVILDLYETPVKVDVLALRDLARTRWQEQMNAWLDEYNELSKNR